MSLFRIHGNAAYCRCCAAPARRMEARTMAYLTEFIAFPVQVGKEAQAAEWLKMPNGSVY